MKINDVVYDSLRQEPDGMYPFDDNYIILKKAVPAFDKNIDQYIANINNAIKCGINTVTIEDYRLYPETKFVMNDDESYTHGLYLEEKAKGKSFDYQSIFILENSTNVNFEEEAVKYLNEVNSYINEIELRSNAPQDYYDKFVSDYIAFKKFNLAVDPKPTNFFFNPDKGFVFIDLVYNTISIDYTNNLVTYLVGAIMGYGKPFISIGRKMVNELPKDLNDRYEVCLSNICAKLTQALINNHLDKLKDKVVFEVRRKSFKSEKTVEVLDMSNHIADVFAKNKALRDKKKAAGLKFN